MIASPDLAPVSSEGDAQPKRASMCLPLSDEHVHIGDGKQETTVLFTRSGHQGYAMTVSRNGCDEGDSGKCKAKVEFTPVETHPVAPFGCSTLLESGSIWLPTLLADSARLDALSREDVSAIVAAILDMLLAWNQSRSGLFKPSCVFLSADLRRAMCLGDPLGMELARRAQVRVLDLGMIITLTTLRWILQPWDAGYVFQMLQKNVCQVAGILQWAPIDRIRGARDEEQWTVAHDAVFNNDVVMTRYLLALCPDLFAERNSEGCTAVQLANCECEECADVLAELSTAAAAYASEPTSPGAASWKHAFHPLVGAQNNCQSAASTSCDSAFVDCLGGEKETDA